MLRSTHLLGPSLLALSLSSLASAAAQAKHSCTVNHAPPNDAERALFHHDLPQAEQLYGAQLKEHPDNTLAAAGLIRVELAQGRLTDAQAFINKQISDHPHDSNLETALGEVELRRGEPEEAVKAFVASQAIDACSARMFFDVSRYENLEGMHGSAHRHLELAHTLAPEDLAINRAWRAADATPLTPEQMIDRLEKRVDAPGSTPEQKSGAAETIKAIRARERGDCEAVADIPSTTLKMVNISNGPAHPTFAVGLDVEMNGKRKRLEVDTGASGLLLSRGSAVSAGLVPEAEIKAGGIGDGGLTGAFVTHVDHIRIGDMQFRNCMVRVLEKRSALDVDGLIGTDVFRNYLVTLDIPSRELRLAPLPKRPDDTSRPSSLATNGENVDDEATAAAPASATPAPPTDRYVAPEMKDWSGIYRVGHQIIVPTRIGNAPTKLFILDTGAATNLISPEAAREVTHVDSNDRMRVRGISGEVRDVSAADNITITFARVQQRNRGMTAIDTSGISRNTGVEIAGFFGFPTLSELILTIDYRDNLIHVAYDPNHGIHVR